MSLRKTTIAAFAATLFGGWMLCSAGADAQAFQTFVKPNPPPVVPPPVVNVLIPRGTALNALIPPADWTPPDTSKPGGEGEDGPKTTGYPGCDGATDPGCDDKKPPCTTADCYDKKEPPCTTIDCAPRKGGGPCVGPNCGFGDKKIPGSSPDPDPTPAATAQANQTCDSDMQVRKHRYGAGRDAMVRGEAALNPCGIAGQGNRRNPR